jgi:hypothetical protein
MTSFVVDLDDDAAERLRLRAAREGVDVVELVRRLLVEASEQDPFAFVGIVASDVLVASDVDGALREHGFGQS